jgi:hypothetical protein
MREDREAQRVLDALEAYLAGRDPTRALRKAFLAGVAVGRQCVAKKLSTGSTGRVVAGASPLGFLPSPLNRPPIPTSQLQDPSSSPDPDLRSIECATSRARETLELVAPGEPVPARRSPERARPKTAWPDGFTLTPTLRAYAERQGLDAGYEWGKFRAHALRDDVRHVNWDRAWEYWVRNAWELAQRHT